MDGDQKHLNNLEIQEPISRIVEDGPVSSPKCGAFMHPISNFALNDHVVTQIAEHYKAGMAALNTVGEAVGSCAVCPPICLCCSTEAVIFMV